MDRHDKLYLSRTVNVPGNSPLDQEKEGAVIPYPPAAKAEFARAALASKVLDPILHLFGRVTRMQEKTKLPRL